MTIAAGFINPTATRAFTGGTELALVSLSDDASSHLTAFGTNPFATKQSMDYSVKRPKVSSTSPDGFTQARRTVLLRWPITLASGSITVNTVSVNMAFSVETPTADIDGMRQAVSDLMTRALYDAFWEDGSLA